MAFLELAEKVLREEKNSLYSFIQNLIFYEIKDNLVRIGIEEIQKDKI